MCGPCGIAQVLSCPFYSRLVVFKTLYYNPHDSVVIVLLRFVFLSVSVTTSVVHRRVVAMRTAR